MRAAGRAGKALSEGQQFTVPGGTTARDTEFGCRSLKLDGFRLPECNCNSKMFCKCMLDVKIQTETNSD